MNKQKGFTLIELLVVIAILGVIAAVIALNVGDFFGRGTVQAANTELHQAQTAVIAAMSDTEGNTLTVNGTEWVGQPNYVVAHGAAGKVADAADYIYGQFRAAYTVTLDGQIVFGSSNITGGWGPNIAWNTTYMAWVRA